MNTETFTNAAGIKFYIEQSADFDDNGRAVAGRGWFAGIMEGNAMTGGVFFETREAAMKAAHEYSGAAA